MLIKVKKGVIKRFEEEFIRTTDTLWESEVAANLLVARVLIGTAMIIMTVLLIDYAGILDIDHAFMTRIGLFSITILLIPAGLCLYFKGRKKWLKILMLLTYTFVCAGIEATMTYNVPLIMICPVVMSVRYYSRPICVSTAILTTLLSGFASYYGIKMGHGLMDLNYIQFLQNAVISLENGSLKDAILNSGATDFAASWTAYMGKAYLPKLLMYGMVATVCAEIAKRGRIAIFSQQAETRKTEKIATELNLASSIQANMLPNIFPAFPEYDGFDIYAAMTPAKAVGGDFYDFFMVDDKHLAMVIADVSGKGIPAAMFMVIAKTLIKDHSQLGLSPGEVFTRVNDLLCEGNEAGLFVTAWMGVLDIENGELVYVNAGHNPPVIMLDGEISYLHSKPGFVLAGMEGYRFTQQNLTLHKGDKIFLYTDGATESCNSENELYGEERLISCLKRLGKNASCTQALKAVRSDIDAFVKDAEQFDDLTLLAFDYTPKNKDKETVEKTFDATDEKLHEVMAFVEEGLEAHGADMKSTMAISVALEEMFVNISHYAYPENKGKATIGMSFDHDEVEIYLIDNGIPFNPLDKEDPDIKAGIEEREVGGLGIFMVKQSMDECRYERRNGQNIFTMRRKIRK
ncbi:MAG: SpoIIE family protein phosphatase [Erysipelotrichaceae bacterium]|nr:SpoIIE family protein phosphatase [Erysipelotrichaceae bacterium]